MVHAAVDNCPGELQIEEREQIIVIYRFSMFSPESSVSIYYLRSHFSFIQLVNPAYLFLMVILVFMAIS